jgi:hypothetical protein
VRLRPTLIRRIVRILGQWHVVVDGITVSLVCALFLALDLERRCRQRWAEMRSVEELVVDLRLLEEAARLRRVRGDGADEIFPRLPGQLARR